MPGDTGVPDLFINLGFDMLTMLMYTIVVPLINQQFFSRGVAQLG